MSRLPSFDELKKLAKNDPVALELLLRQEVNKVIDNREGSSRKRLLGLQFSVDCQKQLAKNPMDALITVYGMMNESLMRLNESLMEFQHTAHLSTPIEHREPSHFSSNIIPFPQNQR